MGDVRYERPYQRVRQAADRAAAIRALADEDVIAALAVASAEKDPYLANAFASEAMNRVRRKGAIVQAANEGLLSLDPDGRLTYLNPAAERMLGWALEDAVGRSAGEVVGAEEAPAALLARVAQTRQPVPRHETAYARRGGSPFPVEQPPPPSCATATWRASSSPSRTSRSASGPRPPCASSPASSRTRTTPSSSTRPRARS